MKHLAVTVCVLSVIAVAVFVIIIDGLTHGGLWKNATWQWLRSLVGNN